MIKTKANINQVQFANAIIKKHDIIRNQNIQLYKINEENNSDNINKKYINSDSCNKLNILTALIKTQDKDKSNIVNKNKQVIQEYIKKEK